MTGGVSQSGAVYSSFQSSNASNAQTQSEDLNSRGRGASALIVVRQIMTILLLIHRVSEDLDCSGDRSVQLDTTTTE